MALIAMLVLIASLIATPAYAANVEVGIAPPTTLERDVTSDLPDVIVVMDEFYEAELKRREEESKWESLGTWKITHYCPCRSCSGKWGYQTSSGATCEEGVTVACGTLPAGTVIKIDGYGERIVQDTGGGVKGNHIDVFYESHKQCKELGVKYKEVFVKRGQ